MTNRSDKQTADVLLLASVLEKLRTHDGLTTARLHAGRSGIAAPLMELAATRRFASVHELDPASAAFDLVATCVGDDLNGTQQIVADAILALGLHTDTYTRAGIEERITLALYSTSLGRRRETLLNHWHRLHQALGHKPGEAPSDRALRGTTEPAVLRELANQLIRRDIYSVGSKTVAMLDAAPTADTPRKGRVIVVGGAVMDATFRIKALPAPETSSEAYGFDLSPGGKALTQAVAAARLGLHTSLIAAVTDDRFGEEILQHLRDEGVDTSLVKRVRGRRTPFTGVFERELGDSIAVNWRNQAEVFLEPEDMDERYDHLAGCDALLMTFEVPRDTMQQTLALAHRTPASRPLVIVTPGQPYVDERISRDAFPRIDYLVAHPWELGHFASQGLSPFDPDPVARNLLAFGVETLCLLVNGGCTVYSGPAHEVLSVPIIPSIYKESAASRDAFCAALAARLIDNDRKFTGEVALWAAAAMSCASADFPLSNSMPDRKRIDALLSRSPFTVTGGGLG
ncbi:carbohydrate kinase family protein [Kribbella sp. NBC_01484]|uniref:carbohydrate kinase family protein n=1 Tax=Kribbella sp. NBC_01484 TaxID=2903579 RepID=UPI002E33BC86|nr:carbohydrate kinase family protein [Kribbella sp. NBC_01484]